jgi:alpha/beta superfamily hydrolase
LLALSITNSLFRVADVEPGFIMATVVAKNLHGKQHTASQRAMIANSLLPFYQSEAKERQVVRKGNQPSTSPQKVADLKKGDARAAAGKAANVNHTYVDKASDIALVDKNLAAGVGERTYAAAVVRFSRDAHPQSDTVMLYVSAAVVRFSRDAHRHVTSR